MSQSSTNQTNWEDPTLQPPERADLLLAVMTVVDKINLVMGNAPALAHLGIPSLERVDASCGLRGDTGVTAFPVPLALAATFDTKLAYAFGRAIAEEARAHGWSIILGPTLDVERRGTSGRLPEGYGEDPLLNGMIGERVARGMQDQHVIPCLKHFTAYNQETDRLTVDVHVSNRALHEIYNTPFYVAIERGSALSIMGSYPRVDGVYACENATLMDDLRAETGWQGFMMSDFMAGNDPIAGFNAGIDTTTLYPDFPREAFLDGRISTARLDQAARRTLYAIFATGLVEHPVGALDQANPVSTPARKALAHYSAEQSIVLLKNRDEILPLTRSRIRTLAVIGCAGRDVITGVEGSSYVIPGDFTTPQTAIANAAGEDIRVLFAQGSHGDHPLPIIPSSAFTAPDGKSSGLLGTYYATPDFSGDPIAVEIISSLDLSSPPIDGLAGSWSARWEGKLTPPTSGWVNFSALCTGTVNVYVNGQRVISGWRIGIDFVTHGNAYPLLGSAHLIGNDPVEFVVEFSTQSNLFDGFMGKHLHIGWQPEQLIPEAVEIASRADTAVVLVNQAAGEGMDRDSFELPGDQNRLVDAICAANPNTIVVLNTPGAVLMPWIERVAAVLQVWYPGEAVGTALASILLGNSDPAGHLPVTFPATENQAIAAYAGSGAIEFTEDVFVGYRHFQEQGHTPLFPFGHGLSYTKFEYSDLQILPLEDSVHAAAVQATVQNVGSRTGSDVVQIYVGKLPAPVATPPMQLAGFDKVTLKPTEAARVEIMIPRRSLSYWDDADHLWKLSEGVVDVYVGNSSVDVRLRGALSILPAVGVQKP